MSGNDEGEGSLLILSLPPRQVKTTPDVRDRRALLKTNIVGVFVNILMINVYQYDLSWDICISSTVVISLCLYSLAFLINISGPLSARGQ